MKISVCCRFVAAVLLVAAVPAWAENPEGLPDNMNGSLRKLVAWQQQQPASLSPVERRARLQTQLDSVNPAHVQLSADTRRVVVDVRLDGSVATDTVRASLESLGAPVFARADKPGAGSVLSVRLPLDQAVAASKLPGVASLSLRRRPHRNIGAVTSQGVSVLKVDQIAPPALDGTGITVGVISDSYDAASLDFDGNPLEIHAAQDVASGDLPGKGNPDGYTQPVVVLQDADPSDTSNTDEGRAMLQIVHDVAPGAKLAFCAGGDTPEALAQNIRDLREVSSARCNVIVDDLEYYEEPYFSDGVAALAVDDVVHNTALAGKPVLYYSAAGNNGDGGSYAADFNAVPDATARAGLANSNLLLDQVPEALTSGGFHNFDPRAGHTLITQRVTVSDTRATLDFQWDSAWLTGDAMTDYNLLVFDTAGNYLAKYSGIDDNRSTGEAIEFVDLPLGPGRSQIDYQLVITRVTPAKLTTPATHLKYLVVSDGNFHAAKVDAVNTPTIYGHSAAVGADAVAAYDYTKLDEPTDYSSEGPVTIYFDSAGNRLATPEVRQQPTISTVDGVDTTFFPLEQGSDTDNDGFPNFSGTSAAAPHAAGVAALLLEAAGGPASLTDVQVRTLLEETAASHDIDPGLATASFTSTDGGTSITLTANGNGSDNSAFSHSFFQLSFSGPADTYLSKVAIDLAPAAEEFDPSNATGFPFKVDQKDSSVAAGDISTDLRGDDPAHPSKLVLKFTPGVVVPGSTLAFGIDRDAVVDHAGGNSADLLAGGTVKFRVTTGTAPAVMAAPDLATFQNVVGNVYSPIVGYGLIDAAAAVQMLRTSGAP